AEAEVETRVLYNGQPVEGERVRCLVGEETPVVEVTVDTMTDADGVARCRFTPTGTETMTGVVVTAATLAYPDVPTVALTLEP
ncbi:MAG: hypothetical protein AAFX99_10300, partial [Myxococcota bacterium]